MIETIFRYIQKYVSPRNRRIFGNWQPWLCALAGFDLAISPSFAHNVIRFELVNQLVVYDFTSFGFTIAAMTIVFAVPNRDFMEFMFEVGEKKPEYGEGPWEDALFIMSWNGFVHFLALVWSFLLLMFAFDYKSDHDPAALNFNHPAIIAMVFLFATIQIYAIVQFIVTMLSIYFFCAAYIRALKNGWRLRRSQRVKTAGPPQFPDQT